MINKELLAFIVHVAKPCTICLIQLFFIVDTSVHTLQIAHLKKKICNFKQDSKGTCTPAQQMTERACWFVTKTHEEDNEAEETWHINRERKEAANQQQASLLMTAPGAAFHVNLTRKLK